MAEFGTMQHEEALIRAFIVPAKRQRYLDKLSSPKARQQFIADNLYHMADLDERYTERLKIHRPLVAFEARRASYIDALYALLRDRGAPSRCYVVSATELDGQEADLREALERVRGSSEGTFISCIPGRLAYFEGETPDQQYILQRSD
jgi:hypothetical protein